MADLATLTIKVDSSSAKQADRDLDSLAERGKAAELSMLKLGAAALTIAAGFAAAKVWEVNSSFESLNASLVTVAKSQERANEIFADLQKFAAETPYSLRETVDAYTTLRVRGIDPSAKSMEALGNLASARQRSINDVVMAVGSLAAGEIEPMKQMGFSVQTLGNKVSISMGDMTVSAKKSSYEIGQAVAQIADAKFGDGMRRQSKTLAGAWSNLNDQLDATLYKLGHGGLNNAMGDGIRGLTDALKDATPAIAEFGTKAVSGSMQAAKFTWEHRDAVMALAVAYASVRVGQGVGAIQSDYNTGKADTFGGKARGITDYVNNLRIARAQELAYAEDEVRSTQSTLAAARAQLAKSEGIDLVKVKSAQQIDIDVAVAAQENAVARALAGRVAAQEALNVAIAKNSGTLSTGGTRQQIESASEIVTIAQARSRAAEATLAQEQAELRRLKTSQSANVVDFERAAMERTRAAQKAAVVTAENAHTASLERQTAAQARNTAAATAGSLAAKGFSSVVAALGGPIGASIALLGTLAVVGPMAWEAMKSPAQKANEDAEKYLKTLEKEVNLLQRKKEFQSQGKQEANFEEPARGKLDELITAAGKTQVKLAKVKKDYDETLNGDRKVILSQEIRDLEGEISQSVNEYNRISSLQLAKKALLDEEEAKRSAKAKADSEEARRQSEAQLAQQKKAQDALKAEADRLQEIKKLREEIATFGMSKDQKEAYAVQKTGLTNSPEWKELQELKRLRSEDIRGSEADADAFELAQRAKRASAQETSQAILDEADAYERVIEAAYPWVQEAKSIQDAMDWTTAAFQGGLIPMERYQKRMTELEVGMMRLKAEAGDTWAIIGYTVTQEAGQATDAMVSWMNNLDGLGYSWKSLGDTVRNVLSDMVLQMQRAVIQQKLMQPLLNGLGAGIGTMGDGEGWSSFASAFGAAWGGAHASGGSVTGGTINLVGERGPELFVPNTSGTVIPNHALGGQQQVNNVSISVTVNEGGKVDTSVKTSGQRGNEIARDLEGLMDAWAVKQMRSGGLLAARG
jgi:hypothetical protein